MKLDIKNVGIVESAEMECKGITVVAGANGTGKSTISKSLFAILNSFYGLTSVASRQRRRSLTRMLVQWQNNAGVFEDMSSSEHMDIRKELKPLFSKKRIEWNDFLAEVEDILHSHDIAECEEGEIEVLYREYIKMQEKGLAFYEKYVIQTIWDDVFANQMNTFGTEKNAKVSCQLDKVFLTIEADKEQMIDYGRSSKTADIKRAIYITTSDLVDLLGKNQRVTRTSRAAEASVANRLLLNLLYEETDLKELTAEDAEILRQQKEVLEDILNQAVHGSVQMKEGRLTYYDEMFEQEVDFSNIASGMKIFIIIKRLLENGVFLQDVLLVMDEPETNLHPAWQLKLAKILVLMKCKLGVEIYVNSHSPYFVRALEYYSAEYDVLEECRFYYMEQDNSTGMCQSRNVTEELGIIYDQMAEPFNQIM